MNRLNKTEYAVFLYCRFSLFLKVPFSRLFILWSFEIKLSSFELPWGAWRLFGDALLSV